MLGFFLPESRCSLDARAFFFFVPFTADSTTHCGYLFLVPAIFLPTVARPEAYASTRESARQKRPPNPFPCSCFLPDVCPVFFPPGPGSVVIPRSHISLRILRLFLRELFCGASPSKKVLTYYFAVEGKRSGTRGAPLLWVVCWPPGVALRRVGLQSLSAR